MSGHIVRSYDADLAELDHITAEMGGLAEQLLIEAFGSLERLNPERASKAIAMDREIDQLERLLQERVIAVIAKRQPLAVDLRQLVANWKVALDLERIGDLSKNIAKRALAITGEPKSRQLSARLTQMVVFARLQLKDVLDAYLKRDADKAVTVWRRDAELDELYNSVFRELLTYMMEDPRNISYCTHLLFVAKNIERIGDHTTNIAETVQFIVRGRMLGDERPKADVTSSMPPVQPRKS